MLLVHILCLTLMYAQFCETLKCYECNSNTQPSCGDPFDPEKNVDFLKECGTPKANGSVPLCRKIDQHIKEHHRIVRYCGSIPYKKDCYIMGSEHYRSYTCACTEDYCNGAPKIGLKWLPLLFTYSIILCIIKTIF